MDAEIDNDSSDIDKMLSLVNKYGLSHVCADPEFKNIEKESDGKQIKPDQRYVLFNFPYLDMHIDGDHFTGGNDTNFEFFLRGTKDKKNKCVLF